MSDRRRNFLLQKVGIFSWWTAAWTQGRRCTGDARGPRPCTSNSSPVTATSSSWRGTTPWPVAPSRPCSPGQASSPRTKPTRWTSERFRATSCRRSACISLTRCVSTPTRDRDQSGFKHFRFDTQTAPLRFLSFPFPRRLLLNFLWRQTFWIVEKSGRSNMINTRHEFLMFEHFPVSDLPYVWMITRTRLVNLYL